MKRLLYLLPLFLVLAARGANPSFQDLTNFSAFQGINVAAMNYASAVGQTDPLARTKINNACQALTQAGLMSHVIDMWIFRTNLNNGSTQSFYGQTPTLLNGPSLVEDGMTFNGTSQIAVYPLPSNVGTHTLVVWLKGVTNQPDAIPCVWTVCNSAGAGNGGLVSIFANNTSAVGQLFTRQGGSAQQAVLWPQSATNQGWQAWDGKFKSVGCGYVLNTSATPYVDGLLGVPLVASLQNITTSLQDLVLGGRTIVNLSTADHFWAGTVSQAIMLDFVPNYQQAWALENAMAWLDPWTARYVVVGDSTSAENILDSPNINWPRQLEMQGYTNAYRFYNMAVTGLKMADWDEFFGGGSHLMTNTYFLGRSGPITESIMDVQLGVNDLYVSGAGPSSDAQNITTCSNIWFQALNHRYTLRGSTVQSVFTNVAVTWKPTMEQARSNLNNFIVTNFPGRFLYRVDAFLDDFVMNTNNAGSASADGLHLNAAGYNRMARMRSAQPAMNFSGAVQNAYLDYTNNYAVDGDIAYYQGLEYLRTNGLWTWIGANNGGTNLIVNTSVNGYTNSSVAPGFGGTNVMQVYVRSTSGTMEIYWASGLNGATVCGTPVTTNTLVAATTPLILPINCGIAIRSGVGIRIDASALTLR